MSLPMITVTAGAVGFIDGDGSPGTGHVTFRPIFPATGGGAIVVPALITAQVEEGFFVEPVELVSNESVPALQYAVTEWIDNCASNRYTITPSGSTLDLSSAPRGGTPVPLYVLASTVGQPDGVASLDDTGNVPLDQLGNAPSSGGAVASVNDLTGVVVLTAADVGADASGAASAAQAAAETFATNAVAAETTRAETSEALKVGKGALVFDVVDYGATGNGTTDDLASIQAAITACSTAGGGIAFLPPGTYEVSAPIAPASNVTLLGCGAATVLKTSANGFIVASSSTPFSDFALDGLTFIGPVGSTVTVPTRTRTTSGNGCTTAVSIDGSLDTTGSFPLITNFTMRNCRVRNCTSLPIRIFGVTGVTRVTDCEFTNCMDVGFGFCAEVICADNHSFSSADNGFSISRGCQKITCTGNTVENAAYYGIWLSGFTGNAGPSVFSCTGNTVRGCGQAGIVLMDNPTYGVVSGNMIDKMYYRGNVEAPDDTTCCGIYVRGSSTSLNTPQWYSTGLNITGNTIKAAAKAGIYLASAVGVKVSDNLMVDCGTQYWADGVTTIPSSYASQNVGVYVDAVATNTNVEISNNTTVDTRATPYCNWGVQPLAAPSVIMFGNTMSGCRNANVLPKPVQSDTFGRTASAQETIPRWAANASIATVSGSNPVKRFAYFTADSAQPMNKISISSGSTAAVTPALVRFVLYIVDASGNITMIGETASDTSIFAATGTGYSRSITTTGLVSVPHQLYCVGCVVSGAATYPTLQGANGNGTDFAVSPPVSAAVIDASTDLASSYTAAQLAQNGSVMYARVTA